LDQPEAEGVLAEEPTAVPAREGFDLLSSLRKLLPLASSTASSLEALAVSANEQSSANVVVELLALAAVAATAVGCDSDSALWYSKA